MSSKVSEIAGINIRNLSQKDKIDYINYLDTANLTNGLFGEIKRLVPEEDIIPSRAQRKIGENDILISTVRPNQKHYGIVKDALPNFIASTGFAVLTPDVCKVNSDYLYYYLTQEHITEYLSKIAEDSTSAYPAINPKVIGDLEINLPPIEEQAFIAEMLASLSKKIELNNRINKTLEEMAQALFKRWFVDFEFPDENGQPYKSSGGEMVESELGLIPKGWRVATLGECVTTVDNRGKTPPLSEDKTGYPVIDVKALSGKSRIIDYNNCTKYVVKDIYDNWFRSGHPKELDVLISTVGSIGALKLYYGNRGCIAQNVVALRSRKMPAHYLYQYLQYIKDDLVSYDIGSVQPSIKVTHIIKHKVLVPDDEILLTFEDIMKRMSEQIFANENQIQTLSSLRDALLPKLMSGEIRVPIEEVAAHV